MAPSNKVLLPQTSALQAIEGMAEMSSERRHVIHTFLSQNIGNIYHLRAMPSDCSMRRYWRVMHGGGSSILMDSLLDKSLSSFLSTQHLLDSNGIRVPNLHAADLGASLLLLEDLGDSTLTRHIASVGEGCEGDMYMRCVEVLLQLLRVTVPVAMPLYDWDMLVKELMVFEKWYLQVNLPSNLHKPAADALYEIFYNWYSDYLLQLPRVLTLHDFMADNIMVVGQQPVLLDFQDAVLGNPAYDLVSFLQDARRDISDAVRIECHRHFFKESAIKQIILRKCYNILGLQRNLKIIGIFTRRHLQDDVDKYLGYLPRVWGHIHGSLDYKFTHPLKLWFEKYGLLRYS